MRARLEFEIPEEACEFEIASKALSYASAWSELKEAIRQKLKYGYPTIKQTETLEELRTLIYDIERDRRLPSY